MKKILWAIDPFQTKKQNINNFSKTLQAMSLVEPCIIQPIYVLSDRLLGLSVPVKSLNSNFKPIAEKALNSTIKAIGLKNIMAPKVLVKNMSSSKELAETLTSYAKLHKFDLIALSTHSRTGLARLFIGSFTETLMQSTSSPLLIVNPKSKVISNFKRILFATDFSKESEVSFKKIISVAKSLKATIVLFHGIAAPVEPVLQGGMFLLGGGAAPIKADFMQLELDQRKKAQTWTNFAKSQKVKCHSLVLSWCTSVPESVLKVARKEKIDLIALTAQSGPVSSFLLGSTTRNVIRAADVPVWVTRNKHK